MISLTLATALHWGGHMLLCKEFAYNSPIYSDHTISFRIQIKRFHFCPAEESAWRTAARPLVLIVLCLTEEVEDVFDAMWSQT